MRAVFILLFLAVALAAADSYDEVKAKIQDLIDGGIGKNDGSRSRGSSDKKSMSQSDRDDYSREKKAKKYDRPSDDYFSGNDDNYESYYKRKNDDEKKRYSDDGDDYYKSRDDSENKPSSSRSRSSGSDSSSNSRYASRSSSESDSSSNEDYYKNHYKNGKKKGFLGKLVEKVAKKFKSIPGKVAAGAAALSGKLVSGVAKLPGKVVEGVKSIPEKAKNILPGGNKKKGDITLNDYTQDSSEQENHFHVHRDKHYHKEQHRHQDNSNNLNVYNDWNGLDDEDEYWPNIYDNYRSKRDTKNQKHHIRRPKSPAKLHRNRKPLNF